MPDPTPAVIPWYQSPVLISQIVTFISAATAIAPKAATTLGWTSTDAISQSITAVFGVVALVATAYGTFKRATAKAQPLTLTQAGADNHPATIAAAKAQGK